MTSVPASASMSFPADPVVFPFLVAVAIALALLLMVLAVAITGSIGRLSRLSVDRTAAAESRSGPASPVRDDPRDCAGSPPESAWGIARPIQPSEADPWLEAGRRLVPAAGPH